MSEFLTIREIATRLRVDPVTVRVWCRQGRLKAVRAGKNWRIKPEDVEEFIRADRRRDVDQKKSEGH